MTETAEKLKVQLSQLSTQERAELAHFLIHSLDEGVDADAEAAWDVELARRMAEIRSGKAVGEPADKVFAEKALRDTEEQIKGLRRQARHATTLEEQHEIQEKIQKLEHQQRRQRQDIFKAEDEIMEKRDALIESLERRLAQRTETATLFTIRWAVK